MRDKCIEAVTAAAGRALTKAEIDGIENRVRAGMRAAMKQDRNAWNGLTTSERVLAGAEFARQQLEHEAEVVKQRKLLQVAKQIETTDRINEALYERPEFAHDKRAREKAVIADMNRTYSKGQGIRADMMRHIMTTIDALKSGQNLVARAFDMANPAMARDILREIYRGADGSTGNDVAKIAAKVISDATEQMRTRFNAAGGDIQRLSYGYVPIVHDGLKILGNGSDAAREAWVDFVMPRLDRSRYLDDSGNQMGDVELRAVLSGEDRQPWEQRNIAAKGQGVPERQYGVWDTLAYDGAAKITPGETGGSSSSLANRGSSQRYLHFRDADAHIEYNTQYGKGDLLDALLRHVDGLSRDIALVEQYGPNAGRTMQTQFELSAKHDLTDLQKVQKGRVSAGAYWDYMSGGPSRPQNPRLAAFFQNYRNLTSAAKLQGTLIPSLADLSTLLVTSNINKVPFFKTLGTAARLKLPGGAEYRASLASQGLIAESLSHGLNRWGTENVGASFSSNLAAATMKFGLVNAWSDSLRTAFQAHMLTQLGEFSRQKWDDISAYDRARLAKHGLTADDWAVVNQAGAQPGAKEFLSPDAIYATGHEHAPDITAKLLGMVSEEGEFAVNTPDLTTKVLTQTDSQLLKMFLQFKNFPISMVSRHLGRAMELYRENASSLPGAPALSNPVYYGAALLLSSTLMGAIIVEVKNLLAGKDPESAVSSDPTRLASFWGRAITQGGGLGFIGDMMNSILTSRDYESAIGSLVGGPGGSFIADPIRIAGSNARDALNGKDTHVGADLFKFGTSNAPLINMFYAKTVLNRLFWDNIAESLSPGVTQRNINRSNKAHGNEFYWNPGSSVPDRAPDLGAAVGAGQ